MFSRSVDVLREKVREEEVQVKTRGGGEGGREGRKEGRREGGQARSVSRACSFSHSTQNAALGKEVMDLEGQLAQIREHREKWQALEVERREGEKERGRKRGRKGGREGGRESGLHRISRLYGYILQGAMDEKHRASLAFFEAE
jgi:septal ring factor EnvC (AmiA/AmiB activator)